LASTALAFPFTLSTDCNLSHATLKVPANQTQLTSPTTAPTFVGLGVGVQNYTCNATSETWVNVGAVAELFDISCLYRDTTAFNSAALGAYDLWSIAPADISAIQLVQIMNFLDAPDILGQHYFVTNPITGSGLSPKFDFTSSGRTAGNPNAFVVGAKTGDLLSPDNSKLDVDWLQLSGVEGDLAKEIFRVQTNGGQPPSNCTAGSPELSVRYTAQYWFFGGSVKP